MIYFHLDGQTVLPIACKPATKEIALANSSPAELYSVTNHHFVSFIDLMISASDLALLSESDTDREIRG